ncbi:MAG: hypothetical protein IH827_04530 [Myxococcales bacterium]|nr:hypothetical protein [Myxococcales bacterium]
MAATTLRLLQMSTRDAWALLVRNQSSISLCRFDCIGSVTIGHFSNRVFKFLAKDAIQVKVKSSGPVLPTEATGVMVPH